MAGVINAFIIIWTVKVRVRQNKQPARDNGEEDSSLRSVSWVGKVSEGSYALGHPVATAISCVLHRVILQRAQVTVALTAPNAFELALPGVRALVLGEVLPLFEALVAMVAFIWFLAGVNAAVPVQVRRVFETFLAFGAF